MAAPQQQTAPATAQPAAAGAIDPNDINDWTNRLKDLLANQQAFSAPKVPGSIPFHNRFIEFFNPIDECILTCFCPCVTFGKTHHRTRKSATLEGYSPINASCLGFWASSWFGVHWIPMLMQRGDVRAKYNLEGTMMEDCLRAYYCGCCDLIQVEKEAVYRSSEAGGNVVAQQYQQPTEEMSYPAKA
jgi:Cys-rich protein (TIGR01571 family)